MAKCILKPLHLHPFSSLCLGPSNSTTRLAATHNDERHLQHKLSVSIGNANKKCLSQVVGKTPTHFRRFRMPPVMPHFGCL
eukprot:1099142-Amphidinium_carterae.1